MGSLEALGTLRMGMDFSRRLLEYGSYSGTQVHDVKKCMQGKQDRTRSESCRNMAFTLARIMRAVLVQVTAYRAVRRLGTAV
jgi:hypothetical protein